MRTSTGPLAVTSMSVEQQWKLVDRYDRPGGNLTTGKSGFHVPGKDELGVAEFRFTPLGL